VVFQSLTNGRLPGPFAGALNRFLKLDELDRLYARARGHAAIARQLLDLLQIDVQASPADLARVPASGPLIAVSNHPFGILDGMVLVDLLTRIRPDVRVLTNRMLGELPELAPLCFFVDAFDNSESRAANGRALRQAITHVRSGGFLLVFPAGEVSHFDIRKRAICDPAWNPIVVRLIRMTQAKALPIYIRGANGLPFQMLGMVHPRLRTAALPAELLNKRGRAVEVRFGSAIDANRIEDIPAGSGIGAVSKDARALAYLRFRTELLARRDSAPSQSSAVAEPIAPHADPAALAREIESLPASSLLEDSRDLTVYLATAPQIPLALAEIGRLRELTFRAVGEGSGNARDLDRFDSTYLHLFLWNREKREIVGAYRLGDIPALISRPRRPGVKALYTESLFRFRPGFFRRLGPALELGRSFIRPEYQRQFAPLLLLWKGIGAYVALRPQYSTLIGAVSVSNSYSPASRELIARFFERQPQSPEWQGAVKARRPLRGNLVHKWEMDSLATLLPGVDDLSEPISDLEPDGKGVPILVRQYAKLGGRLLAFSVDPRFGNTLDGFVVIDLTCTDPAVLARYMGKDQAAAFFAWHSATRIRVA